MIKNIIYFRSKCIGCNTCNTLVPALWHVNTTDGKADLTDAFLKKDRYIRRLWNDEEEAIKQLIPLCPVKAITLQ